MANTRFSGVLAPVITPFQENLNTDDARFVAHCQWLITQGVALALFGTSGEANSLSVDEKIGLLDQLLDAGVDPAMLMLGTGCCALSDSVRLTTHAVELGCKGTLMLPPFYYKGIPDDGLFAFYSEVIERVGNSDLNIYLYHIPPISQIPLSINLINRLVKAYPQNIAGIKDSSGDWENTKALNQQQWPDFKVFCGSESFLLKNMQHGGAGCISATANVNPAAIRDLYENWQTLNAEQKQEDLNKTRNIFENFPMIAALKSATSIYSSDSAWLRVRPPLLPLPGREFSQLQSQLAASGFEMTGL